MAGKGLGWRGGRKEPCGEEDTQQGLDYYSFFVAPQEKSKSAGRKNWFCKNIKWQSHYHYGISGIVK